MKQFSKVRGTQFSRPSELEVGKTTVYVRSNITEVNEGYFVGWEYDEIQYDKDEYIQLLSNKEEVAKLVEVNKTQDMVIEELMFVVIPEISGGGI